MSAIMKSRLSRRTFVSGLALGGAVPYLPSLSRRAEAAVPKRLLVFFTSHGNPYTQWKMRPGGKPDKADWAADLSALAQNEFSEIYSPLWEHRRKLLIFDSLSNAVNVDQKEAKGHFGGPSTVLTSADYASSDGKQAGGPSFDQIIANAVARPGQLKSIELGNNPMAIWQGKSAKLPTERDPVKAFSRLFPMGRSGQTGGAGQLDRNAKLQGARASVLDFVSPRYEALFKQLGRSDAAKVQAHRDLIRDLELQLDVKRDPISCDNLPSVSATNNVNQAVDAYGRLVAAAFACDVTRVASIQLSQMSPGEFGASGGVSDVHQDVAHHDQDPGRLGNMTKFYRKHAEHFATLMKHLDAVPEADGTSLLDNTMVLWVQECGAWIHQTGHLAVVVGGGGFQMGRYFHWGSKPDPLNVAGDNVGIKYNSYSPPISRLLVSIAQKMGVDINQIGTKTAARGLDLRGPLPELT